MKTCVIHKNKKHYAKDLCRFCYRKKYRLFHSTNIKIYNKKYWIENRPFRVAFPIELKDKVLKNGIKPYFVTRDKNLLEKFLFWLGGVLLNASNAKRVSNSSFKTF